MLELLALETEAVPKVCLLVEVAGGAVEGAVRVASLLLEATAASRGDDGFEMVSLLAADCCMTGVGFVNEDGVFTIVFVDEGVVEAVGVFALEAEEVEGAVLGGSLARASSDFPMFGITLLSDGIFVDGAAVVTAVVVALGTPFVFNAGADICGFSLAPEVIGPVAISPFCG